MSNPAHPCGIVVDIIGINRGDCGRRCKEHPKACGEVVLREDVVVCIQNDQILVDDFEAGKGKMKEETALTINRVSDGIDCCRVGFLPRAYVPHGKMWDGVLCQVVFVGLDDDLSLIFHRKHHHYCGYACVAVILAVPSGIKVFDDKFETMM